MDAWQRQCILDEARSYIGTPYHHKGRTRHGIDCGGLIEQVYSKFTTWWPPFPENYEEDWGMHRGGESFYTDNVAPVFDLTTHPVPAGIVLFYFGRTFSHGGIVTEKRRIIHAWGRGPDRGAVIESPPEFFYYSEGRPRPTLYYQLKDGLWRL